jgi:hypothetical protein
VGSKAETTGGAFQVREDDPAPRIGMQLHRTREARPTCGPDRDACAIDARAPWRRYCRRLPHP